MISTELSKILLAVSLQLCLIYTKSIDTFNASNNQVYDYLFKSITILPPCDQDILLVTSSNSIWIPKHVTDSEIAYLGMKTFLTQGLGHFELAFPRCIVMFPLVDSNTSLITDLIHKANSTLNEIGIDLWNPVMILIWPEVVNHGDIQHKNQTKLQFLKNLFQNSHFKIDSDMYTIFVTNTKTLNTASETGIMNYKGSESNVLNYSIWEVYNVKKTQIFQKLITHRIKADAEKVIDKIGKDLDEDLYFDDFTSKNARRGDFMRETFVASTRNESNYEDWISQRIDGDNLTLLGGFSVYLYWDLMTMLNFSEGLVIGEGLITLPDEKLSGKTVLQINSGEADISLSQSLIVGFRAEQLTFLQPTYFGIIHVFFKQPPASSIRNIVTAPFQTSLWLTLIATWLFLILAVKISSYFKSWWYRLHDIYWINPDLELSKEIGMWAISTICQKSWTTSPSSTAMRMAFLIGLFCSVVTYVAYSAAIVSTLSVSLVPVERFLDLLVFNFVFTVHKSSDPFQIFLKRMIESFHLRQDVVRVSTEMEISHLMNPLKPRAFLTYPDLFYQTAVQLNYTEMFVCNHISKVRVSDVLYKSGMFLKKGSEFTEIINHKLIILKERGFNFRYLQEYERKNVFSCVSNVDGHGRVEPVLFSDVFTAFLVVFIGLILALIIVVCEIFVFKMKETKRRIRDYNAAIRP